MKKFFWFMLFSSQAIGTCEFTMYSLSEIDIDRLKRVKKESNFSEVSFKSVHGKSVKCQYPSVERFNQDRAKIVNTFPINRVSDCIDPTQPRTTAPTQSSTLSPTSCQVTIDLKYDTFRKGESIALLIEGTLGNAKLVGLSNDRLKAIYSFPSPNDFSREKVDVKRFYVENISECSNQCNNLFYTKEADNLSETVSQIFQNVEKNALAAAKDFENFTIDYAETERAKDGSFYFSVLTTAHDPCTIYRETYKDIGINPKPPMLIDLRTLTTVVYPMKSKSGFLTDSDSIAITGLEDPAEFTRNGEVFEEKLKKLVNACKGVPKNSRIQNVIQADLEERTRMWHRFNDLIIKANSGSDAEKQFAREQIGNSRLSFFVPGLNSAADAIRAQHLAKDAAAAEEARILAEKKAAADADIASKRAGRVWNVYNSMERAMPSTNTSPGANAAVQFMNTVQQAVGLGIPNQNNVPSIVTPPASLPTDYVTPDFRAHALEAELAKDSAKVNQRVKGVKDENAARNAAIKANADKTAAERAALLERQKAESDSRRAQQLLNDRARSDSAEKCTEFGDSVGCKSLKE